MNLQKTIDTLEALASGCSPRTGEIISNDSVLNEREVIRALQLAIDRLKVDLNQEAIEVHIPHEEIREAQEVFESIDKTGTWNQLLGFFLATRKFRSEELISHKLYGKYADKYTKGQLLDYLTKILKSENKSEKPPWQEIRYFDGAAFNKLSPSAIHNLEKAIGRLGIQKTEELSDYVREARINHPRAYEAWTNEEKDLLQRALIYTNDLSFLSKTFQRGVGSIRTNGQKLLYEKLISQRQES